MSTITAVKAQEPFTCEGCGHTIREDQRSPADILRQVPEGLAPGAFRPFHTMCYECKPGRPCYSLYVASHTPFAAQTRTECAWCDHPIYPGQDVLRDSLLVWNPEQVKNTPGKVSGGFAALNTPAPKPASFGSLSSRLKQKFRLAGLGNGRGSHTAYEAEMFFRHSVPSPVRNMGAEAVGDFLKDKHASHIESVANAPGKAKIMGNMVWESRKRNWSRGPRNMTGVDRLRAHAKNRVDAARLGAKGFGAQLGKAAAFAALLELPVSAVENTIRVVKGSVSGKEAAKQTAKNTATAGAIGGVTAVGITGAVALGAGPAVTALSPIVAPAGAAIYGISAVLRIRGAMQESLPLVAMALYFHAGCVECKAEKTCYESFAAGTTPCPEAA